MAYVFLGATSVLDYAMSLVGGKMKYNILRGLDFGGLLGQPKLILLRTIVIDYALYRWTQRVGVFPWGSPILLSQ